MSDTSEQRSSTLKELKKLKGITSGKFKNLQKNTHEYNQLLTQMKIISEKISLLEKEIKSENNFGSPIKPVAVTTEQQPFQIPDINKILSEEVVIQLNDFDAVADWKYFVTINKTGLPSHNPAWAGVIRKTFGHHSFILCARTSTGTLVGGIPLTVLSSPFFGKMAVSMPYLNYGGVISEYYDVCIKLMQTLDGIRQQLHLKNIEIRSIQNSIGPKPSTKKASMLLRLPKNDTDLENALGSKVRAQYKKAEEFSPSTKIGKQELLSDFYRVFSHNMRDLGTPVYAKKWFENILLCKELDSHIIIIYLNKKPVSCGFLINHGSLMEIPWASTLKSANKFNINMWMYRKVLSFAIQNGCKYFDFGRSTIGAGTYKFKKQWGAEPCQNYWYSILPNGTPKPEMNPDNPKLKIFIRLWKLLPVWIANIIGPHIIKNIP